MRGEFMPQGPGKYDAEATRAREATEAGAVVLMVIQGKYGSGFSVQVSSTTDTPKAREVVLRLIASGLSDVAAQIVREADNLSKRGF